MVVASGCAPLASTGPPLIGGGEEACKKAVDEVRELQRARR